MAIKGLNIIAEKINDSVPSTHKLFENGDIEDIVKLAKEQASDGADYIDVNIGLRTPELMKELVKRIQNEVNTPLSIDSPSFEVAKAGFEVYDIKKSNGKKPILNSISLSRLEMFELKEVTDFKMILMASEHRCENRILPNKTTEDIIVAAHEIFDIASKYGVQNDDIIFDPTLAPVGSDFNGYTNMTLTGIESIKNENKFKGCHISVGLSNFTVMLPSKTAGGNQVKTPLECAFLTLAVPRGLDFYVGNTKKNYLFLDNEQPAMKALNDIMKLEGYDILMRVQEFYNS